MPQWLAGCLKNREKAQLEGGRCTEAPMVPGANFVAGLREATTGSCVKAQLEDGKICMQRKHGARKHGKFVRNVQNKVIMGERGLFARDFPQNAPRVSNQGYTEGSRGSENDNMGRSR